MCFESLLLNDLFYEISFIKYLKNRKIKKKIRKQNEEWSKNNLYNIDNHFNEYYDPLALCADRLNPKGLTREKRHRALRPR